MLAAPPFTHTHTPCTASTATVDTMLPKLLELCYDAVPNVRLCLANLCLHCMTDQQHTPSTDVISAVGGVGVLPCLCFELFVGCAVCFCLFGVRTWPVFTLSSGIKNQQHNKTTNNCRVDCVFVLQQKATGGNRKQQEETIALHIPDTHQHHPPFHPHTHIHTHRCATPSHSSSSTPTVM